MIGRIHSIRGGGGDLLLRCELRHAFKCEAMAGEYIHDWNDVPRALDRFGADLRIWRERRIYTTNCDSEILGGDALSSSKTDVKLTCERPRLIPECAKAKLSAEN